MMLILVVFIAIQSIWTPIFSSRWWGGAIVLFLVFIVIPNLVGLLKSFWYVRSLKNLKAVYDENELEFRMFISGTQMFWSMNDYQNSSISIQIGEYTFLNYRGPRDMVSAVNALWNDYKHYKG